MGDYEKDFVKHIDIPVSANNLSWCFQSHFEFSVTFFTA